MNGQSIKKTFLYVDLILLIIIITSLLITQTVLQKNMLKQVKAHHHRTTAFFSDEINHIIEGEITFLGALISIAHLNQNLLEKAINAHGFILLDNLFIIDRRFSVKKIINRRQTKSLIGIDISSSRLAKYIRIAQKEQKTIYTPYLQSILSGKSNVSLIIPYKGYFYIFELNANKILSILKKTFHELYKKNEFLITSPKNNQIIYRSSSIYPYWSFTFPKKDYLYLRGNQYIYKQKKLKTFNITLIVLTPKKLFTATTDFFQNIFLLLSFIIILFYLFRSLFLFKGFIRPIGDFLSAFESKRTVKVSSPFKEWLILANAYNAALNFATTVIEESPAVICGIAPDGTCTFINPAGEQVIGANKKEMLGENWWETFFPGKEKQQVKKLFSDFKKNVMHDYEMTLTRKDGQTRTIVWNFLNRTDEENNLLEIIGFGNNITARKKAEEDLRTLITNIPGITYRSAYDKDWTMEFISDETKNITGYPSSDFINNKRRSYASIINPDDEEKINQILEHSIKTKTPYTVEYRIKRADNQTRWLFEKGQAIFGDNNEILYLDGVILDITERKQAEEELLHLRNYLSNIIDSMPSVLVGVDPNGAITQWNLEAKRISGISHTEAIGQSLAHTIPRLAEEMKHIQEAIKNRQKITDARRVYFKEGERRYEDLTIYPLIANGVQGAVIRIDDITDRVRIEEMMVQSEKMLSVGGLAAGMAHEINNPLAGIIQAASVIELRLNEKIDMPPNQKAAQEAGTSIEAIKKFMDKRDIPEMLKIIIDSGQRVADIVLNVLSFSRKSEAKKSLVNIEEILDKTLELAATDFDLKKQYDFKLIEIKKEYSENLPKISCEKTKIQQVVLNLLRNGAHAMQEAKTEKPHFIFRIYQEEAKEKVCIEIEDNGPGMDEETRRRAFEPFYSTKQVGTGTGLGLSVSYFIITENHNGEMLLESEPGRGTKFTIRLPINQ